MVRPLGTPQDVSFFGKQLRLHAACQKMLTEELDAASAAFQVGYETPSQFNREYKRFFGKPPDARRAGIASAPVIVKSLLHIDHE